MFDFTVFLFLAGIVCVLIGIVGAIVAVTSKRTKKPWIIATVGGVIVAFAGMMIGAVTSEPAPSAKASHHSIKPTVEIVSGVSKETGKAIERNNHIKVKVKATKPAKYIIISYGGVAVTSYKIPASRVVTYRDSAFFDSKVTAFATKKNYDYDTDNSKIKSVAKVTFKGAGTHKDDPSSSSSSSADTSSVKKSNEEKNYQQFLQAVANVPATTKNAISAANYDESTQTLTLVLTDDALSLQPAELKAVTKSAWDAGHRLYNQYSPMPDSKTGTGWVVIQDSAGDQLAKSSFFGGFKYTGE